MSASRKVRQELSRRRAFRADPNSAALQNHRQSVAQQHCRDRTELSLPPPSPCRWPDECGGCLLGFPECRRAARQAIAARHRSEEHTSELQYLMRISYAVFFLKKKNEQKQTH